MWKLALRNVTRQKVRTLMTLLAIAAGVASLILSGGFVEDIFVQLREFTVHSQTGHVQVYRKGYFEFGTQAPLKYIIEDAAAVSGKLRKLGEVEDVMARLRFSGLINNGRADQAILGEGIEPDKEAKLGTYVNIIAGRQLAAQDRFGIMVGEGVAQSQQLRPGDRVTLVLNTKEGALNSLDFEVIGVFRTFSKEFDARAVRIGLDSAQELLMTPGVNSIVVSLHDSLATDRVRERIDAELGGSGFEAKTWHELSDFYSKTVALYERQFGVLRLIILGMVLLGVANSVNMSVMERVGEFGTMLALGDGRRSIVSLVMAENAMVGAAGAVCGAVLGVLLAVAISAVGIPMPPPPNSDVGYIARIQIVPSVILSSIAVGFLAACGAAVLPARRVARTPIADALRHNI
jgi:putative ABC transport system permease protein